MIDTLCARDRKGTIPTGHSTHKTAHAGIFILLLLSQGFGQIKLTQYSPLPPLNGIAWTGTQFVAVGDTGSILSSPDMAFWSIRDAGTKRSLHSVTWTGSLIVVVGDSGTILTSSDAIQWSSVNAGETAGLNSVIWTGATLMAIGENGVVLMSGDGTHWTSGSTGDTHDLYAVAFANGLFVAVGGYNHPTGRAVIFTSPDGVQWTDRSSDSTKTCPYYYALASMLNRFVAIGEWRVAASSDGVNWVSVSMYPTNEKYFHSVTTDGNRFVAINNSGELYFSSNGLDWTDQKTQNPTACYWRSLAWIDSQYVAVGAGGSIVSCGDGSSGKKMISGIHDHLFSVAWNGELFVTGGVSDYGALHTSKDGINWTSWSLSFNCLFSKIIWTGKRFVAMGGSYRDGIVYTSNDGLFWSLDYSCNDNIHSAVWNGTQLVAVGDGGLILTSPDGLDWTKRNGGTDEDLNSIVWTGNRFVAKGCTDTTFPLVTSEDGQNWQCSKVSLAQNVGNSIFQLIWTGAQFAEFGTDGCIYTSLDAQYWVRGNHFPKAVLNSFTWTGKQFVGVAENGTIFASPDGLVWTNTVWDSTNHFYRVEWTGNRLVILGQNGLILMSPEETEAAVSPSTIRKASPKFSVASTYRKAVKVNLGSGWDSKKISLGIFNVQGKCLQRAVHNGQSPAFSFNGDNLASGRYFLQAEVGGRKVICPFLMRK